MMNGDQGPAETRTANGTRQGLVPNAMGWVAAAAIGAIIMSPAGGIYFNFGPMVVKAGAVASSDPAAIAAR